MPAGDDGGGGQRQPLAAGGRISRFWEGGPDRCRQQSTSTGLAARASAEGQRKGGDEQKPKGTDGPPHPGHLELAKCRPEIAGEIAPCCRVALEYEVCLIRIKRADDVSPFFCWRIEPGSPAHYRAPTCIRHHHLRHISHSVLSCRKRETRGAQSRAWAVVAVRTATSFRTSDL